MTAPDRRAALIAALAEHVEAHPLVPSDPPTPAGCAVLQALTVDCAALAIGGSFQVGAIVCKSKEVKS